MQSRATTVEAYLKELPADRRAALQAVRQVILKNLDKDYAEGMSYGMIGYYVPHSVYPPGYHCDPKQPLPFAGLASQKNHMSIYLMSAYGDDETDRWLRDQFARAGKKLDMGRCCVRFKRLEDLPLEVIGEVIRRTPAKAYIAQYEAAIRSMNKRAAKSPGTAKPTPAAKTAKGKPSARTASTKKRATKAGSARKSARSR